MERIILYLQGTGNTGKTITLNFLIELLKAEVNHTDVPKLENASREDNRKHFLFEGFVIGVCTPGDNIDEINKNMEYFKEHNCDICVTAVHCRQSDAWRELKKCDCSLELLMRCCKDKTIEKEQNEQNLERAKAILDKLRVLMHRVE